MMDFSKNRNKIHIRKSSDNEVPSYHLHLLNIDFFFLFIALNCCQLQKLTILTTQRNNINLTNPSHKIINQIATG